jgi:hypothetical protein
MVSGFALLMPVAPLWVIHGGSDDPGAGLVTGEAGKMRRLV